MPQAYGRQRLSGLALAQIQQAEQDPRLDPSVGLRDAFYAATGEAERLRLLAQGGLMQTSRQLETARTNDPDELQALWEQEHLAQLMVRADHPHLNAMTLVAIYSAVDALIETMVPARAEAMLALRGLAVLRALDMDPERAQQMLEAAMATDQIKQALAKVVKDAGRVGSSGLSRYERHLEVAVLADFPDRPFPADLDVALKEISALRNVLLHGGARVDARAVASAPTLPERGYAEGAFVRIGGEHYRTYSAALLTFAEEVLDRMLIQTGTERPNRLADWRANASWGA